MTSFLLTYPHTLPDVSLSNLHIFLTSFARNVTNEMKVMVKVQKKVILSYVKD